MKPRTVLLVEDDAAVRLSLTMGLAKQQEFKILEAGSGDEALAVCRSYKGTIDVVVVDIEMPRMWGHEFVTGLAQLRPGTPILYISGHSAELLVSHGILTGNEPFLAKPFDGKVLAKKLNEILDPPDPSTRPNKRVPLAVERSATEMNLTADDADSRR